MIKLTIEASNFDKLTDYIEFIVLPQLKEGYRAGLHHNASWETEGIEEFDDEDN